MKKIFGFLKFIASFILIYTAFVVFLFLFFRFVDPPATSFIYADSDAITGLFSWSDIKHKSVSIQNMSKYAPLAAIASEDQMFFEHFGFDFQQIEKAMKENKRRKRVRGASTISMQVAKNLFLWNTKLVIRKGFEAYYTLLMESLWSKERILEVYLNVAEMGKGIYGIETASQIYYKKKAIKLNASEAATIIAILPNPKKRNPKRPTGYLLNRRAHILEQMNLIGGVGILKEGISY
ncbi:MAG: monofunctional biosynthetic peptidoglycan transglycosylase [Stygiobacter sp. RIFOXYC12_FULL_38_8]|nr:MAG: monofunctional biosynthetic peptidoglycan transglycosylase [Stygiobacter sp. RIFOXYA12_FULL_38_9]OGV09408.1 MAG: monofunctional biosynthetic peptidoglycan transglycosylase [Stygiobacter sp. RIFOXYB2_FULL_37_11]OGV09900.1 MAG: monofunctional biosynthetic peptidoglycan transglycosylase [Stygiobacter sp. RIFOXYA2_FULL_38_8]OGV15365.1 MAG: monofunctional biosynthetic peptidoglycan transglycosylase [Stygiobacter sp. RIFOXYC2_FULL_38_25]OGV27790.1 MAG: monofunctional biosynthetic peptidoglyca